MPEPVDTTTRSRGHLRLVEPLWTDSESRPTPGPGGTLVFSHEVRGGSGSMSTSVPAQPRGLSWRYRNETLFASWDVPGCSAEQVHVEVTAAGIELHASAPAAAMSGAPARSAAAIVPLPLSGVLDPESVVADVTDGRLTLTAQVLRPARPRLRVIVGSGSPLQGAHPA